MKNFIRNRRRIQPPAPDPGRPSQAARLESLVAAIADSQAQLLLIANRVAAGRGAPGDESRLRIQREITASYQKRLEKMDLPLGLADETEAWLRSMTAPVDSP